MKKYIPILLIFLPLVGVHAAQNLYEFYDGHLPSIRERAVIYQGVAEDTYQGTARQNTQLLNHLQTQKESALFGASVSTPEARALFETTLANRISASSTNMTLTSATDKDGNTLASSTYGFIIDEGLSNEELVLADCTGTACTNMTRGLSVSTATTSISALQQEHRRGASVKMTDAPILLFLKNVVNGRQNLENALKYTSSVSCSGSSSNKTICPKDYMDALAIAGASDANTTTKGIVEIATRTEVASTTSTGSTGAILAIPASAATSTPGANVIGGSGNTYVVSTRDDNTIHPNFIATSSLDVYRFGGQIYHQFATTTFNGVDYKFMPEIPSNMASGTVWAMGATTSPSGVSFSAVPIATSSRAFPASLANLQITTFLPNATTSFISVAATTTKTQTDVNGVLALQKSIKVSMPGVYTVCFSLAQPTASGETATGRIYVDEVAIGTSRTSTSATYASYCENINVGKAYQSIQLYSTIASASGGDTVGVKDFVVSFIPSIYPIIVLD